MPTKEDLFSALRQADAAGDTQAAQLFANDLKTGRYDDGTTVAGGLLEATKGIPRGFASSILTGGEGLTELADAATNYIGAEDLLDSGDENEMVKLLRAGREGVQKAIPRDPAYEDKYLPMIGEGLGSLASFFVPGLAAGKLGTAMNLTQKGIKAMEVAGATTLGVGMGAGEQAQRVEAKRQAGQLVPEEREDASVALGGAIGASEVIPILHFLRGVPANQESVRAARGALSKVRNWLKERDITTLSGSRRVATTAAEEAIQEGLAGLLQDYVAKYNYDPNLEPGESVADDAIVGGAVGAIAEMVFRSASGRRRQVISDEDMARSREMEQEAQKSYEARRQAMDRDRALREEQAPAFFEGKAPADIPVPEGATPDEQAREIATTMGALFPTGTYFRAEGPRVVDAQGQQYGPQQPSTALATELAVALNRQVITANVMGMTDAAIDRSGIDYTPEQRATIRTIGQRFLRPERHMVTEAQIQAAEQDADFGGELVPHAFMTPEEAMATGLRPGQLTPLQQFQRRRELAGQERLTEFTPVQARKILGDKYSRIVDVKAGMPLTYMTTAVGGEIMVRDTENVGEPIGPFDTIEQARAERDRLNALKGYAAGVDPSLFEDTREGVRKIEEALADKNIEDDINSRAVRSLAEAVTGRSARGRTRIQGFTPGELRHLYHEIRTLPRFDTPTRLPDFTVRPRQAMPVSDVAAPLALPGPTPEQDRLAKLVRQAMKGYGLERVGTNLVDRIRPTEADTRGRQTAGVRVEDGRPVPAEPAPLDVEGAYAPWMDQIFIGLENIRSRAYEAGPIQPGEELSAEQIEAAALDTLSHEILHAMREADLFTQREWEILERAARETMVPGTQLSYLQDIQLHPDYSEETAVTQMEEAVANLTRDVLRGRTKLAGKPRSLMRRIVEFIKRMFRVADRAGLQSPSEIFEAIERGEIGRRQRGVTRSLMRAERVAGAVPLRDIGAPVAPPTAPTAPPDEDAIPSPKGQATPDFGELYQIRSKTPENQWQRKMLQLANSKSDDFEISVPAPKNLRDAGILDKLTLTRRRLTRIASKHSGIPSDVVMRLPELLAKPAMAYTYRGGRGINLVLNALTRNGDPIVVGIENKRISTIYGFTSNDPSMTGLQALAQKIKTEERVPVEALASRRRKVSPVGKDPERPSVERTGAKPKTLTQVSWESIPGATANHMPEAFTAEQDVLLDYHRAISSAFLDETGDDIVAKKLGISSPGDFEAPGHFEGRVSPGTQTEIEPQPGSKPLINMYAAVRGILMKQDGVGWHRPFFLSGLTKARANGVQIDIGRVLSEAETAEMGRLMAEISGHGEYNPIGSPQGARLINFDYLETSNEDFHRMVETMLSEMQFDNNESFEATLFASENGYLANDWREQPNGEGYLQDGTGGRPDLQERVNDLVAQIQPRIDAVEAEFADRYGWTRRPEILSEQRAARPEPPAVRPGGGIHSGRATQGIILGEGQALGESVAGVHYGREQVDQLEAARSGTGIKGAEQARLQHADDARLRNRVYFYVERPDQGLMRPEPGLGQHVYSQRFNNILTPTSAIGAELVDRVKRSTGLASGTPGFMNAFESAVVDAGYDGYSVPSKGMMVILNHDVPVNYLGTRQGLSQKGLSHTDMLDVEPIRPDVSQPTGHPPDAVRKAVDDNMSEIAEVPKGQVPRMSGRGTPEAQYVARNPEQGAKPKPGVKEMASRRRATISSPTIDRIIDSTTAAPPVGPTPFESYMDATGEGKLSYWLSKFRQEALQRYSRLEKLNVSTELRRHLADSSSIAAALFADRSRGVVAAAIKSGVPVYENGITKVQRLILNNDTGEYYAKSVEEDVADNETEYRGLMDVMRQLNHPEFGNLTTVAQTYAIMQRANRIDAEGREVPIDAADRAAFEAEVDSTYGMDDYNPIKRWYRDWQAYNDFTIRFLRDTGVLSEETADLWRSYSDYYPFYRAAEDNVGGHLALGQRVFGGLTSKTAIRELRGGETPINMDMIEAVSLNLTAAIDMGMKNVAQQRIVRDMVELGLAEEVTPDMQTKLDPVSFYVNGQTREFVIYDPLIYESMQSLDGDATVALVRNTAGRFATLLRETITRDPGFMFVNMLRDTLSAWVTSGSDFTPVVDTAKGWMEETERLEVYGVAGGYDYSTDPDDLMSFWEKEMARRERNGLPLNMFRVLWDALGHATTRSDAATRNAVYDDVLARTGNEAEAAFQSMEVINFSRRGRSVLARVLTTSIPFLNARFQGLDVLLRAFNGNYSANMNLNRGQIIRSAVARGGILAGLTSLYWLLVSDDDQYKEQTDEVRDNNWIIPLPETFSPAPAKLPIPFEVGLLFKVIPETILDTVLGDRTTREAADTLTRGVVSTLEMNPLGVQMVAPLIEASLNHNFFTGREIVPYYMSKNVAAGLQERVNTNELARDIGHALNISPMKVEHVLRGYVGTLGTYILDGIDVGLRTAKGDPKNLMPKMQPYEWPVIRRFFASPEGTGLKQDAYDLYFAVSKVKGTMSNLMQDGRVHELQAYLAGREHLLALEGATSSVKSALDTIRKQREAIMRSDMDRDLKHHLIMDLDAQANAMLKLPIPELKEAANLPIRWLDPLYQ